MKNYNKLIRFDLSNCDTEPIHIIGRIQAHGFLIIIDNNDKIIQQVSRNIKDLTGFTAEDCINRPLEQVFSQETYQTLNASLEGSVHVPFPVKVRDRYYICFLNKSDNNLLLEFEPTINISIDSHQRLNGFLAQTIAALNKKESMEEISAYAADSIQRLLDYDRVMIYQFDVDWHGHVVGEKVKKGVRSYYNHHFPASDIPEQAREMLVKKGVRQIPDTHAESIEIVPYFNSSTGNPTNIIYSELRNPSEIHLEYLKNMDVKATLSIAIMVKSKLWGLVCCHHHSPIFIDYFQRNIAQLITTFYASAILSAREVENKELAAKYIAVEKTLIEQMEENLNITQGLFSRSTTLLDLSEATGATILLEDKLVCIGKCPNETEIKEIVDWASSQDLPRVFSTRELTKYYPPAFRFKDVASGLMIIELSKHTKEYILCYKPQTKETISWAGNPDKSLQIDVHKKLHPRKSFEKWEQEIQGKSTPWTSLEEERANSLAKSVVSIQLRCQAEKLSKLNVQLEDALTQLEFKNSQLEDFTRIASHNLFGPLNNIQALIKLYDRKADFQTAQLALEKIDTVSGNMRQTLQDLHQILEISSIKDLQKDPVDIWQLIDREKQNLINQITETGACIHTDIRVPIIRYPRVYLESIIHNFLSNALKYSSSERKPEITIKTWEEKNRIMLEITDNGLGIDLEKHGPKLFGLYKTFHRNEDSRGLGLYLVKKQVEALGGEIHVKSEEGKGSSFTVQLKKFA